MWLICAYLFFAAFNAGFIYACARRAKSYPRWKVATFSALYGALWLPLNVVLNIGAILWLTEGRGL